MAEVFGSKKELCKEDDLLHGRLPSPHQLRGKIVLKGTYSEVSENKNILIFVLLKILVLLKTLVLLKILVSYLGFKQWSFSSETKASCH